jgi:ParB family transcriptional regulator, chromosome partitioning protein
MSNEIEMIPLNKLVASPHNVRKTRSREGVDEFQASLLFHGVLENLIVYETANGKFAVAAGERRRSGLKALAKVKKIPSNFPVPCLIRPEDEAIELSLAENTLREPMHPADQYVAFAALLAEGKSVEDVAARFGVTPAIVTRRMKLGRVSPVIIQAYRDDEITLEAVMAFTVSENHAEQEQVFAEISQRGSGFYRNFIVRMLTHDKVPTDDRRFLFIGEEAYLAAGGGIVRDLFDEEGGGYATDSALLERLALEKLSLDLETIKAGGWRWIEITTVYSYEMRRGFAVINPKRQTLSADDQARQTELIARAVEIAELTGGMEPEDGPLAEEYLCLQTELANMESREYVFDPAEIALAGGWLTLDDEGHPVTELGHVRTDDIAELDALRRTGVAEADDPDSEGYAGEGEGAGAGDETGENGEDNSGDRLSSPGDKSALSSASETTGLSDALLTDLHAARTVALRLELADRPHIALRAVAHSLAAHLIGQETGALAVNAREIYIPAIAQSRCADDERLRRRVQQWEERLPDRPGALWAAIMALPESDLFDLIAVCAALSLDATHSRTADGANRQRLAHADQLAETMGLNMAQYWTATAEGFFSRVNKTAILDAVAEATSDKAARRLDGLKKPIMAAEAEAAVAIQKPTFAGLLSVIHLIVR